MKFDVFQAEKRKILMDHETQKMSELEESYEVEAKEWKENLRPRKLVNIRITVLE